MWTIGRTVLALLGVVLLATACSSKHTSFTASTTPSPVATSANLPAAITSSAASPRPSSARSSPDASTPPPTARPTTATPTTATPTTATPTTQGGSARIVLTDKDAVVDATRTVTVGTIIEVDLTVTAPNGVRAALSSNEAVVATISSGGDESSASQSVFRAVAPGTANLYAMIDAACPPDTGCGAAAGYSFAISVVPAR